MDFSKKSVEDLINKYAIVDVVLRDRNLEDVFVLASGATIRLPAGFGRIPYQYVELIADIKLGLSHWDFDYWAGENS